MGVLGSVGGIGEVLEVCMCVCVCVWMCVGCVMCERECLGPG